MGEHRHQTSPLLFINMLTVIYRICCQNVNDQSHKGEFVAHDCILQPLLPLVLQTDLAKKTFFVSVGINL